MGTYTILIRRMLRLSSFKVSSVADQDKFINKKELGEDMDYLTGHVDAEVHASRMGDLKVQAEGALAMRMCINGAFATAECPLVSITLGVLAGGVAIGEGFMIRSMIKSRGREEQKALSDQHMVKSWL